MVPKTANASRQTRIDSWKAVARCLGRSTRTVQRWHREYGLPIHRLGVNRGSVFAYEDELDRWLRSRDQTPGEMLPGFPKLVTLPPARSPAGQAGSHLLDEAFDPRLIARSEKIRAAKMTASAYKLWANLSNDSLKRVTRIFRQAVDMDPGNVEALAGLSHALIAGSMLGSLPGPEACISAKAALEQALALDAELPDVKCAAAWLQMVWERDWLGARRGFDECLSQRLPASRALVGRALLYVAEDRPTLACGLLHEVTRRQALDAAAMALCCWTTYLAGESSDALGLIEQARASGHSGPVLDAVEALACIQTEEPNLHIARIDNLVGDSPQNGLLRGALGYAYALAGRPKRANEILREITRPASGQKSSVPYAAALILTGLNENHDAVQWLEQSYRDGSLWSLGFPSDPALKSLHDTPSYRVFLGRSNYPPPSRRGEMNEGSRAVFGEALQASSA